MVSYFPHRNESDKNCPRVSQKCSIIPLTDEAVRDNNTGQEGTTDSLAENWSLSLSYILGIRSRCEGVCGGQGMETLRKTLLTVLPGRFDVFLPKHHL